MCENHAMTRKAGAMHVETSRSHQTRKDGTARVYQRHLLRRSYRQGGKVRKQTLANLSHLPDEAIAALRLVLAGKTVVDADAALEVARSPPHGHVAAVHTIARQLGLPALLGRRHLREGGIAMFDLSSSWVEGTHNQLAAFGYSRDGKRGKPQIEYGLLCDQEGRPVAVRVVAGSTADPTALTQAVEVVRGSFDLYQLILVGDRGMITTARIQALKQRNDDPDTPDGFAWITALRAPQVKKLAADDGPLQLSLFDQQDLAEIASPDYPGERLVACRNPLLASERARKRADLPAAT